jgi:Zn-dependent M28 family amino/carboxypeptidase
MGYAPEVQPFTAIGEDDGEEIESANVVAVKEGDSDQRIIVGAHYDSSDEGLGTDDNASGVAVLLEAAELVADGTTPYTIVFIAFGGEEAGILGSTTYVGEMDADEIENTILFINMDSIVAGDIAYVYGDSADGDTARDWALGWAGDNGYDLETVEDADLSQDGESTADYAPFLEAGIPWIYFEATDWTLGNEDGYTQVDPQYGKDGAIIHTEYDNLEYLDETFPGRVDAHLDLYIAVLYNLLTAYQSPQQD